MELLRRLLARFVPKNKIWWELQRCIFVCDSVLSDRDIPDAPFGDTHPWVWDGEVKLLENGAIPCWSLAALLRIIPKHIKDFNVLRIDIGEKDFAIWYDEIGYGVNTELPNITTECPIDACYEMIVKLYEQKML